MDTVPDPILPEKFPEYSRESNPGPLGWQSDVLTTIPHRRSFQNNSKLTYKEQYGSGFPFYLFILFFFFFEQEIM